MSSKTKQSLPLSTIMHLARYGLLLIAVLIICRFFDTNISFVIRGLLFVAVGAVFFFANSKLIKKRNQHEV